MDMQNKNVPVFVKINDYKEILDVVDVMKQKLTETRRCIAKVNQLKEQEDQEIDQWEKNIAEITKRLSFIDAAFFEND
jgi:hypothetical protein